MKFAVRARVWLAVILAVVGPSAAAQTTATKLTPLNEWKAEHLDGLCTLTRQFGQKTAPTTVQLRNRDPWNGGFNVVITSEKFSTTGQEFTAGWLPNGRFITIHRPTYVEGADGPNTVVFQHGLWNGATPKKETAEYTEYWSRDEQGEIVGPKIFKQNIESFLVDGAFERPLLFATGPMKKLMETRDACIDEMLQAKGVDISIEDRNDHIVKLANSRFVARDIFSRTPSNFRFPENWAGVTFLVFLDAKAQVTTCDLNSLPYDSEFKSFGCRMLTEKAKFKFKKGETPQPAFFKLHASMKQLERLIP